MLCTVEFHILNSHRVQHINQHASSAAGMVPLILLLDGAVWCRIH